MNASHNWLFSFIATAAVCAISSQAQAVPYASAVRNTTGSMYEFVLNEAADNVTVTRDGGNALDLGALSAGRHTFDLESFSAFDISATKSTPVGWTTISDPANLFTNFFRPTGMAINTDPASDFFGTVYVANPNPAPTASGRTMGDGVYALTADLMGVDLANNFAVVTDANDATQAKAPGWTVDGSTTASPWRMSLDEAGNLIVSDWSDADGGIKYAAPDLATGGLVLEHEDGIRPLFLDSATLTHEIHGSIASKAYVTGSVGNNLTVYAMDEDYDLDHETLNNAVEGNHVWKWNVGNETEYDQPPELVINVGELPNAFLNLNVGVNAKIHYSPEFDKWYLTQYRFDGNQTGLVVVDADGPGADLADPNAPVALWDSLQFSLDNNLDGHTDETVLPGIQDVFRFAGDVTISNDGSHLLLHRVGGNGAVNPTMANIGDGAVVVIPLDANGVPDIQIDDNGTPGDTSDDILTNVETIEITSNASLHAPSTLVELDAAGNLYIGSNISELIEVFSPGGSWRTIFGSDGTFSVEELVDEQLDGDYNDDGVVNAADYVVFRNNNGQSVTIPNDVTPGTVDTSDYDVWVQNFGNTLPGSGASGAVPEPTSVLLLVAGALAAVMSRRR